MSGSDVRREPDVVRHPGEGWRRFTTAKLVIQHLQATEHQGTGFLRSQE